LATLSQDPPIPDDFHKDSGAVDRAPVVAFDFDGTLTVKDSFMAFLRWRVSGPRWALGLLRLLPAALAYLVRRDRGRIKAAAVREFLKGVPRADLEAQAKVFAETGARKLLRPDAVAAWKRWRSDHVRLAIVTASPDLIVAPFARGLGADELIGTRLAFDDQDRVTGAFLTPNCRGAEKVVRLRAELGQDVELKAAYGDTAGDREMLAMAEIQGYRVFKGTP
jgi:phosphatidylglycerophosphatase C